MILVNPKDINRFYPKQIMIVTDGPVMYFRH